MVQRFHVLVVDDDSLVRRAIARKLETDFDVCCAGSCHEGLEALTGRTFDLVVCDYDLGDGTGLEVLSQVGVSHPDTKRVLLSGSAPNGAGDFADLVLAKPFPPELAQLLFELVVRTLR